jgi:hypothetical protein
LPSPFTFINSVLPAKHLFDHHRSASFIGKLS